MAGVAIGGAVVSAGMAGAGMAQSASAAAQNKKMMEQLWALAQQGAAPYQKFGKAGMKMYQQMLPQILAQMQYQDFTPEMYKDSPLYTPMVRNLAELQATPGYQFQLEQGQKQLDQSAAARGGLLSGAQLQAAQQFGQKQAATGFQDAWKRAQDAYVNAFNVHNASQTGRRAGALGQAGTLGDITKMGYTASMGPASIAAGVAPSVMESNMQNAQNQAEGYAAIGSSFGKGLGGVYDYGKSEGWWGKGSGKGGL